jgi:hypothetical protein
VDRIILTDAYDSTALVRRGDTWMINDTEEAGKIPVENILIAAERLEISSIVTHSPEPVAETSRTLTFFEGEKVVLSFRMLVLDTRYLIVPTGSEHSYYVSVSGYPGLQLEKVFSADPNHYREHLLLDLLPSEISLIELELPEGDGYRLIQDREGEISFFPARDPQAISPANLNERAIRMLLSYFTGIVYEDKTTLPADSLIFSAKSAKPLARLHVESHDGMKHTLQVFSYVENPGGEAHMFRALVVYNNEPYALIVNYIYLDVLMRDQTVYLGEN